MKLLNLKVCRRVSDLSRYEAEGYDVVLLLVSCHDLEGIQVNAARRERTIPAATIER